MKRFRGSVVVMLSVGLAAACSYQAASDEMTKPSATRQVDISGEAPQRVTGEYLIVLAPGAGEDAIRRAFAKHRFEIVKDLGKSRYLIRFTPDPGLEYLQGVVEGDNDIRSVQSNLIYRPSRL